MNINMNTSASLAQNTSDLIGLTVLKKAINIEAQNAMALINDIPQPPRQGAANLSLYLGQNINTIA